MQIRTVKELKSPARDLPEGIDLTVGADISEAVAADLVRDGYAVEVKETEKLKKPKRGEG